MRKYFISSVAIVVVFTLFFAGNVFVKEASASGSEIKIYIDSAPLAVSEKPVTVNGTTLVPMRSIFEALGFSVSWNQKTATATGTKGDLTITLTINKKTATVNGANKTLSVAPQIINGSTLIPLRFLSENAGYSVKWSAEENTISITSPNLWTSNDMDAFITYTDTKGVTLTLTREQWSEYFYTFEGTDLPQQLYGQFFRDWWNATHEEEIVYTYDISEGTSSNTSTVTLKPDSKFYYTWYGETELEAEGIVLDTDGVSAHTEVMDEPGGGSNTVLHVTGVITLKEKSTNKELMTFTLDDVLDKYNKTVKNGIRIVVSASSFSVTVKLNGEDLIHAGII